MRPEVQLTPVEARVVGSLIEKAALTPDIYPMTTNALVSACNQKTNREPVVDYDAVTIDAALLELRQRNIVRRVHAPGSRATKHRQALDEVLGLDDAELAVMSVLLLRGSQTVGELRLRTERQYEFASIDAVERCLDSLAARPAALVRQLPRSPGQKEPRWQHLLLDGTGDAVEAVHESEAGRWRAGDDEPSPSVTAAAPGPADRLAARVEALEREVATLRSQLTRLAAQLGESLD